MSEQCPACGLYDEEICRLVYCVRRAWRGGGGMHPHYPKQLLPSTPSPVPVSPPYVPPPRGCICPPGANKECENPTCPRKPRSTISSQVGAR
jgi:hypothetical protein